MEDDSEELNRVFRAVGDTTRRRIIEELRKRDNQSLFEIYTRVVTQDGIGQSRQGFSRHLNALEEAGIITVQWQGTTKLHSLDTRPLVRLATGWLASFKEKKQ